MYKQYLKQVFRSFDVGGDGRLHLAMTQASEVVDRTFTEADAERCLASAAFVIKECIDARTKAEQQPKEAPAEQQPEQQAAVEQA